MMIADATSDVKTPMARLYDLLAGWAKYVEEEEGKYPDCVTGDELGTLYGDAAQIEPTNEEIARFVNEKVLPLLLK